MSSIILNNAAIRLNDGLYNLNDLHKASGGDKNHQPAFFIRNEKTIDLINELAKSANSQNSIKTVRGANGGTYACKELVYAYAMWISAAFTLTVIRAFDAIHAPKAKKAPATPALYPPPPPSNPVTSSASPPAKLADG